MPHAFRMGEHARDRVALARLFRLTGKRLGSSHVLTTARGIASFHSSEVYHDSRAVTPACDTVQRTRREDNLAAVQEVLRERGAGLAPARRTAGGGREESWREVQTRRSEGRSSMIRPFQQRVKSRAGRQHRRVRKIAPRGGRTRHGLRGDFAHAVGRSDRLLILPELLRSCPAQPSISPRLV